MPSPRKAPRRVGRLASRRLRVLASLLPAAAGAANIGEVCSKTAELLAEDSELFPFVQVFLRSGTEVELISTAGAPPPGLEPNAWPLEQAIETGVPVRVHRPAALAVPIAGRQVEQSAIGVLVTGVVPRFVDDPDHPTFLQLISAQLAAGLAGVAWAQESSHLRAEMARAVELEHLKSDFLRLASHELRGPLAVVRGYLDMVNGGTFGAVSDKLETVLPIVTGKIDEMNRLVEQMLETARIDDNRLTLSRGQLDLRELTRECANAIAPYARAAHRFRFDLGTEPVLVTADRTRIAGVITNVIDNAIKYSPEGGEIEVAVEAGDDGLAKVRVTDEGLGVAPEDLPRLFTRFGRVVTPENSHISGTGLGLYLAREITRMHGGDIALTSKVGSGTTVEISLPLTVSDSETAASLAASDRTR
jgi:signal transduction histidine kinase